MIFLNAQQQPVEKPAGEPVEWRVGLYPLVFSADDKVLMIQSNFSGKYEFPGGKMELQESIAEGLARECLEETGYKIKLVSQTPIYSGEQYFFGNITKKFYHAIHLFYEAELIEEKSSASLIDPDGETAKVDRIALDQLTEANCQAIHWPVIQLLRD